MNELLVICPSRSRPKMLSEMVESFVATSRISALVVLVDNDDPDCLENIKIIKSAGGDCDYVLGKRDTTTNLINNAFSYFAPHKFYSTTNDDFKYLTHGWDVILTEEIKRNGKVGIAYGNDLLQGKQIPSTSVISREIVSALGWLQLPTLTHLYGDSVWQYIGRSANCLHYRPDVIIEHKHYFSKKVPADDTFLRTNSSAMYNRDNRAFCDWIANQASADVQKVKGLLNGAA